MSDKVGVMQYTLCVYVVKSDCDVMYSSHDVIQMPRLMSYMDWVWCDQENGCDEADTVSVMAHV